MPDGIAGLCCTLVCVQIRSLEKKLRGGFEGSFEASPLHGRASEFASPSEMSKAPASGFPAQTGKAAVQELESAPQRHPNGAGHTKGIGQREWQPETPKTTPANKACKQDFFPVKSEELGGAPDRCQSAALPDCAASSDGMSDAELIAMLAGCASSGRAPAQEERCNDRHTAHEDALHEATEENPVISLYMGDEAADMASSFLTDRFKHTFDAIGSIECEFSASDDMA